MQIELKRIQREVGITFVYVTHDQSEALTMSDRIAVMNDGLVEQLAGPREIYERPATTFVAGFIGTSNLLARHRHRGRPADRGGRVLVPQHDGEVSVTVRPEKITLSVEKPDGDLSVVPGDRGRGGLPGHATTATP